MLILLGAVVTASLLGSLHCVGMCGPLAIWASGASNPEGRGRIWKVSACYHLGRLTTYLGMGLVAGSVGSLVTSGGELIGIQLLAARLAGGLMIVVGLWQLRRWLPQRLTAISLGSPSRTSWVARQLTRIRPQLLRLPDRSRAYASGLLTTFLPCGWLYLFALVAASTGGTLAGGLVMLAFWAGTVPALQGLMLGARLLSRRFTRAIPSLAAAVLVTTGCFTMAGRGFAAVPSMLELSQAKQISEVGSDEELGQQVSQLNHSDLPCCSREGCP